MDDRRLGMAVRARRHRRGWRLVDLAAAAGVGAGVCGLLERGEVERLSVRTARAVVAAVGLPLNWDVGWQRQEIDRLLDADHSTLAVHLTRRLEPHGWIVRSEVSFNHYGDRGRIDLLTYHPGARVLLVIEIKTAIVDGGELLGTLDVKTRVAPTLMRTLGWQPLHVIPAIILAGGTTVRRRVTDLDPLLRRFDLRGRAAWAWLAQPTAGPSGILAFLKLPSGNTVDRRRAGRRRVRAKVGGSRSATTIPEAAASPERR
jgi:transcriptional regulator with XRE-family HTH domain